MNTRSGRSGSVHFTGTSPGARLGQSPIDAETGPPAEAHIGSDSTNALFFNDNDAGSAP